MDSIRHYPRNWKYYFLDQNHVKVRFEGTCPLEKSESLFESEPLSLYTAAALWLKMKRLRIWDERGRLDAEMEKRADGADASVLFFLPGCANSFWLYVQIR